MDYPRMTQDERVKSGAAKLTQENIFAIRSLRHKGSTYNSIANVMHVNKTTVMYWCLEDFRKRRSHSSSLGAIKRWKRLSPELKSMMQKRRHVRIMQRIHEDPVYAAWYRENARLKQRLLKERQNETNYVLK